jgi:hypothetical protein
MRFCIVLWLNHVWKWSCNGEKLRTTSLQPYFKAFNFRRIWRPLGDDYEDVCLVGCGFVQTGMSLINLKKSLLPPSSWRWKCLLMMEAVSISETLLNSYQYTRSCNTEDTHIHRDFLRVFRYLALSYALKLLY